MSEFSTLVEMFERSTQKFVARPLFGQKVTGAWVWHTYRNFASDVRHLAGGLAKKGVGPGDRVAIISANSEGWATAMYATLSLGATFVPMYETQSEKDWQHILADSGAKFLFVANWNLLRRAEIMKNYLPELQHVVCLERGAQLEGYPELLFDGIANPAPKVEVSREDIACIIYTSGTTGQPKGVELTHGNIVSNVLGVRRLYPFDVNERCLSFLPWAHSFGQTCELHTFISYGCSIAICEGVDKIVDNLGEVQPTILCAVPRIFNKIYDGVQKQISEKPKIVQSIFRRALVAADAKRAGQSAGWINSLSLRIADKVIFSKVRQKFGGRLQYAVSGGAALSPDVARFIDTLGIAVYEGYGLTETSPIVSCNYPGHRKLGSVGKTLEGVGVVIDFTAAEGLADGEGEVIVFGPNVMRGYHNMPEETEKVMTEGGGYRTGDIGWMDDQGYLHITGRIKEQYKLENGKYVAPAPLEEQLKLSPFITNVLVYGDNRPHNVALVVPDQAAVDAWLEENKDMLLAPEQTRDSTVNSLMRTELEKYSESFKGFEKVRKIAVVDEDFTQENGLLTPTMKLKRRKVIEQYADLLEKLYE